MSRLVFNRNGGSADEYGHLQGLNRLLTGDVIEGMQVQANTSPSMGGIVGQGSARISTGTYPSSYGYFVGIDTTTGSPAGEAFTVSTANASNPRNDIVVAYVDMSVTPSSATPNNPNNMLKIAVVPGTAAASPADPTNSAIQSAIGAANPFIKLARIRVTTAMTQVTTAQIDDLRTFVQLPAVSLGTSWATYTPTFTNLSVGSSTVDARWSRTGKTIRYRLSVVLGGSNVPTGSVSFSLPVPAATYSGVLTTQTIGVGTYNDSNVTVYEGRAVLASSTTANLVAMPANGVWVTIFPVSATNPFTFGPGDEIFIQGEYEALQ